MRLHATLSIIAAALLVRSGSCRHVPRSPVSKCAFHSADKRRHANLSQCLTESRVDATKKEVFVSLVVSGSAGHIEEATATLTSMLYFRTCPLHVYMFTDDANLRIMMQRPPWNETSAHSLLKVSYITVPDHTENVTFGVPNTFHAKYSILKAVMDRLIPSTVDRLVAADIDVLWVGDVCDIESEFDGWHEDAFIGVAPEESGWYLQPDKMEGKYAISAEHPYKINGVDGLNGGMIYYNLAKARAANWTGAWTDYIRGLKHPNPLPLGDQDVINRFGTIAPQFIHILPNSWNHQLIHGNKCGTAFWQGVRVLHGNAGTMMTDTVTKHWWPYFAHADLAHHRGHIWQPHSAVDRCAARSFLACLSREGAICDGTGFVFDDGARLTPPLV